MPIKSALFDRYATLHANVRRLLCDEDVNVAQRTLLRHKLLIWKCVGFESCGGVGDRFAGLFTASMLAVLTDRVFLVKYPGFEAVFEPANTRVNWLLDDKLETCIMRASYELDHPNTDQ